MGRVNKPQLSEIEQLSLEKGLKDGTNHAFRKRCQLILLKSEGRESAEVGAILKMHCNSVNHWVKRYKSAGLAGLVTRHGRGRKPKLNKAEHGEQARKSVEKYRQRMLAAKADFEAESGKEVSRQTLRRFLKSLVEDTNASEDA